MKNKTVTPNILSAKIYKYMFKYKTSQPSSTKFVCEILWNVKINIHETIILMKYNFHSSPGLADILTYQTNQQFSSFR